MDKVREALERIVQLWEGDHAIPAHDLLFEARNIARVALSQSEGWIATEDKKPERGQTVFAFWEPESGLKPGGHNYGSTTYLGGDEWVNPENEEDDYAPPTLWMLIPPLPNKEMK